MSHVSRGRAAATPGSPGDPRKRNVYCGLTFELRAFRFLRDVPSLVKGTPYFRVEWRRGQAERGQTNWAPLRQEPATKAWAAAWNEPVRIDKVHLAVLSAEQPDPQKKALHFRVRKAVNRAQCDNPDSCETIATLQWRLAFDTSRDGMQEQLEERVSKPGAAEPYAVLSLARRLTRLSAEEEALARDEKAGRSAQRRREASPAASGSGGALVPYSAAPPSAALTQYSAAQSPYAYGSAVAPHAPPDALSMRASEEEALQLKIQRTHTQIYAQAKALREKRAEVAYLRERYSALSADYNELRHELALTERQYTAKKAALEREETVTGEMRQMRSQIAEWRQEDAEDEERSFREERALRRAAEAEAAEAKDGCVVQ